MKNILEGNRKLNWLGWDYLKKNDVGALKEEIEAVFMEEVRKNKES